MTFNTRDKQILLIVQKTTEAYKNQLDSECQRRKYFMTLLEESLIFNNARVVCADYAMKIAKKQGWESPFKRGRPIKNF